jgi:hypothetical protein
VFPIVHNMDEAQKCAVCCEAIGPHLHQLRDSDLEPILKNQVLQKEVTLKVKKGACVCCRHFKAHSHLHRERWRLVVKTEHCGPAYLETTSPAIVLEDIKKKSQVPSEKKQIRSHVMLAK